MSPTRIPPTTGAISRRGRTWPSSSRARATSTGRRNCSRRTRNGTQAGRRRDQPSSWSNRCAAKRCWPPPGARRNLTRGDLPSPRRAWPWSRREESPRGEEPRAAGAERRGGIRGAAEAASGRAACRCARRAQIPRRRGATVMDRDFQTQHKLLLLETLYDAGLSLGSLPDEEALVEDVLGRAVGVLDASRGYLATFGEGGARRAEARVGFPRRPSESAVAEDEFLQELLRAESALRRESFRLLRSPVSAA